MFTKQEEEVAQQAAEMIGAVLNALPAMTDEKADAYVNLISDKLKVVATLPPAENKIKDVTENVVDFLSAIGDVLPEVPDPKKMRQRSRFRAAVGMIKNLLRLFGL